MSYWQGSMSWPLVASWVCETCGLGPGMEDKAEDHHAVVQMIWGSLTWGLANGVCRCNRCHTQYTMRVDGERVTVPVSMLKPGYQEAAKWAWNKWGQPLDELSDYKWDKAIAAVQVEQP